MKKARIINLKKIEDIRGSLSVIEGGIDIPFEIKRVYFLYDIPGGAERGSHAHKSLHQMLVAISGSFDVVLDDGISTKTFHLNRSYMGLYAAPMTWRTINNFSTGAVCLVMASEHYDECDYIRNYDDFKSKIASKK